jgi:hypothetical protein
MPYEFGRRAADAYNYLWAVGCPAFAWEFLRRNSIYQADYRPIARSIARQGDTAPEMSELIAGRWGLRFMVAPDLRGDLAPVVWLPHLNPATVVVAQAPDGFTEARSIGGLTPVFSRRTAIDEHWLLDREGDGLPVALVGGADTTRAVVVIPLDSSFTMRVQAADRLRHTMMNRGPGRAPDRLTAEQRSRLILILRALDCHLAGCSYRTTAKTLFGPEAVPAQAEWQDSPLRSHTIRLCKRGLDLMHEKYLNLLYGSRRRRNW